MIKNDREKIKQINNLIIRYREDNGYSVWTQKGICWEDSLSLEQAENYCRETLDFVSRVPRTGTKGSRR